MNRRALLVAIAVLSATTLALPAFADKAEQVHNGFILSVTADTLAMSDVDGKNEHAHKIDTATAITLDGKAAKLPELSKGDKVRVSVGQDGKVTKIEATRKK